MLKTVNDQIVKSDAKLLQRSEEAAAESVKEITKTNKTISEILAREKAKDKALEKASASQKWVVSSDVIRRGEENMSFEGDEGWEGARKGGREEGTVQIGEEVVWSKACVIIMPQDLIWDERRTEKMRGDKASWDVKGETDV